MAGLEGGEGATHQLVDSAVTGLTVAAAGACECDAADAAGAAAESAEGSRGGEGGVCCEAEERGEAREGGEDDAASIGANVSHCVAGAGGAAAAAGGRAAEFRRRWRSVGSE